MPPASDALLNPEWTRLARENRGGLVHPFSRAPRRYAVSMLKSLSSFLSTRRPCPHRRRRRLPLFVPVDEFDPPEAQGVCYNCVMTKLLEDAISKVRQLSEAEQDAIARIVLDEIESERRWDEMFARSPEKLSVLAD